MDEEVKILCVDDEQNVLNALKRLFIDEDYTIITASSGEEGLKCLAQGQVQIIISDYRMPGMDGVEFLSEVCTRWPQTIRIVLSGYADTASIVEAINEGQIYKFIPKPWDDEDLKATVSNAAERYFLYKRNTELSAELREKNQELLRLNMELQKLLEEKSANLEFRSKVLTAHQNILDSMPVAIAGIDFDNLLVLCNSMWFVLTGIDGCLLGQSVVGNMPEEILDLIDEIKQERSTSRMVKINGIYGKLLGALMDNGEGQRGVILVFSSEEQKA
jgi:two-component system, NtrC family, sensor kinase